MENFEDIKYDPCNLNKYSSIKNLINNCYYVILSNKTVNEEIEKDMEENIENLEQYQNKFQEMEEIQKKREEIQKKRGETILKKYEEKLEELKKEREKEEELKKELEKKEREKKEELKKQKEKEQKEKEEFQKKQEEKKQKEKEEIRKIRLAKFKGGANDDILIQIYIKNDSGIFYLEMTTFEFIKYIILNKDNINQRKINFYDVNKHLIENIDSIFVYLLQNTKYYFTKYLLNYILNKLKQNQTITFDNIDEKIILSINYGGKKYEDVENSIFGFLYILLEIENVSSTILQLFYNDSKEMLVGFEKNLSFLREKTSSIFFKGFIDYILSGSITFIKDTSTNKEVIKEIVDNNFTFSSERNSFLNYENQKQKLNLSNIIFESNKIIESENQSSTQSITEENQIEQNDKVILSSLEKNENDEELDEELNEELNEELDEEVKKYNESNEKVDIINDDSEKEDYIFLFKLDIDETNNLNNKNIFDNICNSNILGEGDYVVKIPDNFFMKGINRFKRMLNLQSSGDKYIIKKTLVDRNFNIQAILKKVDANFEEITEEESTPPVLLNKLTKVKDKNILPIKYINGILLKLNELKNIVEQESNDDIIIFLKELKDYIIKHYGDNGKLLISVLEKTIDTKSLDKLFFLLLNKFDYNIFGNKNFNNFSNKARNASQINTLLSDTIENDLPKKIYLNIFLKIMNKFIFRNGKNYRTAKIINIENGKCNIIIKGEEDGEGKLNDSKIIKSVKIYENDYNQLINRKNTNYYEEMLYIEKKNENIIRFILTYFTNSEYPNFTNNQIFEYYNFFKTNILTALSIFKNDKISKIIQESKISENINSAKNYFNRFNTTNKVSSMAGGRRKIIKNKTKRYDKNKTKRYNKKKFIKLN
jgi:flagellar biosynthesis GTPase FlhF